MVVENTPPDVIRTAPLELRSLNRLSSEPYFRQRAGRSLSLTAPSLLLTDTFSQTVLVTPILIAIHITTTNGTVIDQAPIELLKLCRTVNGGDEG